MEQPQQPEQQGLATNAEQESSAGNKSFFTELRERDVFKAAAAYGVCGWLIVQVTTSVFPAFGLPNWTIRFVVLLVLLGFPVALVLAWMLDVTENGIRLSASSGGRKLNYVIGISAAGVVLSYWLFGNLEGRTLVVDEPEAVAINTAAPVVRFTVPIGEGEDVYLGGVAGANYGRPTSPSVAISPDGTLLAYSAWHAEESGQIVSRLYLRRMAEERVQEVQDSDGASVPFFSPDGEWLGFIAGNTIKRVPVAGGALETVVANLGPGRPRGACWGDDGNIVYNDVQEGIPVIKQVAASGGEPRVIADMLGEDNIGYQLYQPQTLPGGRVLLFHRAPSFDPQLSEIVARDITVPNGNTTVLLANATDPHYIGTGHLLFMRKGSLMAVAFDPSTLEVKGNPVVVLDNVMHSLSMPQDGYNTGAGQLAISSAGHLVYAEGGMFPAKSSIEVVKVSPTGEEQVLAVQPRALLGVRQSPDGTRLALFGQEPDGSYGIYVHELARNLTAKLPTIGFVNSWPQWSPDSQSLLYSSDRDLVFSMYTQSIDGTTPPQKLPDAGQNRIAAGWSSDNTIAFQQNGDIWTLSPVGDEAPFVATEANEARLQFSPDGRWMVYDVIGNGGAQVYVRPYPGPGPATQISVNGGFSATWSADQRQIFYLEPISQSSNRWVAVDVQPGVPFQVGTPRTLIEDWRYIITSPIRSFDQLPDGSLLALRPHLEIGPDGQPLPEVSDRERFKVTEFHVVLNFMSELQARLGPG